MMTYVQWEEARTVDQLQEKFLRRSGLMHLWEWAQDMTIIVTLW